jgi:hypothetical protein
MKAKIVLCLAFSLLLVGCDDSTSPLSDPQKSKLDSQLLGVWRGGEKDGGMAYYHVGRAGEKFPDGVLRVVEVSHSDGKVEPPEEYLAFPNVLGNTTYLNLASDPQQVKLMDEKGWKAGKV